MHSKIMSNFPNSFKFCKKTVVNEDITIFQPEDIMCHVCDSLKKQYLFGHFYGSRIKVCNACKIFFQRLAIKNLQTEDENQMKRLKRCLDVGMQKCLVNTRQKRTENPKSFKHIPEWMDEASVEELLSNYNKDQKEESQSYHYVKIDGNSINSNNTTDNEKKIFNAGNPVLGILKDKTPPSKRLISGHLIYSNQDGLQITFSGDAVQELSEDQLAYVQQEFINQASKLQSEALEQGLVPPTKIEIELL